MNIATNLNDLPCQVQLPSRAIIRQSLLSKVLAKENLPFDVRASTSESRSEGGRDQPDLAFYDGAGDYFVVCGEVKLPSVEIRDIASSVGRNDRIGRYLVQTGVVLVSNVRGFGLLTVGRSRCSTLGSRGIG